MPCVGSKKRHFLGTRLVWKPTNLGYRFLGFRSLVGKAAAFHAVKLTDGVAHCEGWALTDVFSMRSLCRLNSVSRHSQCSRNVLSMRSQRQLNVLSTQSRGYLNAISMHSRGNLKATLMLSQCALNVFSMHSQCNLREVLM